MKKEERNQLRSGLIRAVVADVIAAADPARSGTSAYAKAMADRQPRSVLGGCRRRVRWALLGFVGPKKFMKSLMAEFPDKSGLKITICNLRLTQLGQARGFGWGEAFPGNLRAG
ncbi:MAG TPA: hypothetical protein VG347_03925, partial [Verrucomicrobiae bacterium]|nr:hypothetical protein [Verrucomicrobiae bacterium]